MRNKATKIIGIVLIAIVLNTAFISEYFGYGTAYTVLIDFAILIIGVNAWLLITSRHKEKEYNDCQERLNEYIRKHGYGVFTFQSGEELIAAYHYYKLTGVLRRLPAQTIDVAAKYDELLREELEELISFAAAHGWKSRRHEEGENYRRLITQHMYPDEQ